MMLGHSSPLPNRWHRPIHPTSTTSQALAPDRKLNARFLKIVGEGTGKTFEFEHNQRWDKVTRPILEAFFHARFFLERAVRSARTLRGPPQLLPSDWAALRYLFDLR